MYFDAYGNEKNSVLILLHGAAALDTFANQYDLLAREFRVLVPHLPGAGEPACLFEMQIGDQQRAARRPI